MPVWRWQGRCINGNPNSYALPHLGALGRSSLSQSSRSSPKLLFLSESHALLLHPIQTNQVRPVIAHENSGLNNDVTGCSETKACDCDASGICNCAKPRKIKRTGKACKKLVDSTKVDTHPASLRDLRPALPKPSQSKHLVEHVPSIGHPSGSRHHAHTESLYSPYGRAYEAASNPPNPRYDADLLENVPALHNVVITNPEGESIPWDVFKASTGTLSLCGCGSTCACTGCFQHRGSASAFQALLDPTINSGCADPNICTSCVECSIILPPPTSSEMQNVEEWLRQLGASPSPQAVEYSGMSNTTPSPQYGDPSINIDTTEDWIYNQFNGASECCGGSCRCPPGLCSCPSDCSGNVQDCADGYQHEGLSLSFAVSGERVACCSADNGDSTVHDHSRLLTPTSIPTPPSSDSSYRSRASSVSDSGFGLRPVHFSDPHRVGAQERTTLSSESFFDECDII